MDQAATLAETPRLSPIDRPPTLLVWLTFLVFRAMLGKVIMPARVLYTRMPSLVLPMLGMYRLIAWGTSLDPRLVELVQLRVSLRNGCAFCSDVHAHGARRRGVDPRQAQEGSALSPAFRAALAYVDAVRPDGAPDDASFAEARRHFSERALVELTWLAAFTGYLNAMAKAVGIGSDGFCTPQDRPPPA
jgi:AhpD family alkylhydroperoxidase